MNKIFLLITFSFIGFAAQPSQADDASDPSSAENQRAIEMIKQTNQATICVSDDPRKVEADLGRRVQALIKGFGNKIRVEQLVTGGNQNYLTLCAVIQSY